MAAAGLGMWGVTAAQCSHDPFPPEAHGAGLGDRAASWHQTGWYPLPGLCPLPPGRNVQPQVLRLCWGRALGL